MKKQKIESVVKLKDGRELYKTHNGFKHFVVSKKGVHAEVTEAYWNKCKLNRVTKKNR